MAEAAKDTIQSDSEAIAGGTTQGELWLKKIERAQLEEKEWREEAKVAVQAYEASEDKQPIAFNIFHSNIETLIPALYNSSPVPDVRRRFGDSDPIAKQVVDLSERALSYSIDQYDIDAAFVGAIRDAAVTGRGVLRVRYIANENGAQDATCERWPWDKFIRGPARSWAKMPWVAFELDLTKDELTKLDPAKAKKMSLGERSDAENDASKSKDPTGVLKTHRMYEIWDKATGRVIFVDDQKELWAEMDDPMQLPDFFPVMKPLQPVQRPSSLIPVCQYTVYKPLLDELDTVTKRISKLVKQLRVRGLIDSEMAVDFEGLKTAEDGQYKAAQNAAVFASQGGLEKAIAHWPMDPIVKALQQLYLQRDAIKQTIYEVTGISDILRGASNANETATAQNIKNQWGSLRIQRQQAEVSAMARDLFRAKVVLFAKHFSDENLQLMTSLPAPDKPEQQQMWPQVLQLFRSDVRSFRIDIETDSTIRADMTRNQEQMNSFLAGTAQFATAMAGIVQIPQIGQGALPVIVEVFTAFARKFKLGKQAEDALDGLSGAVQQMAQQPQQEQPDPEAEKLKMQMQAQQQKAQLDQQTMAAKAQHEERMAQLAEKKASMEIQLKQMELQMKREEMALNLQAKQAEHQMKAQDMALQAHASREESELASQERHESFAMNQAERQSGVEMMHAKNAAQKQSMSDKAKFQKQQQQGKRANA